MEPNIGPCKNAITGNRIIMIMPFTISLIFPVSMLASRNNNPNNENMTPMPNPQAIVNSLTNSMYPIVSFWSFIFMALNASNTGLVKLAAFLRKRKM